MTDKRIVLTTRHMVSLLVDGNYKEMERLTQGKRLSKEEVSQAVREYGRKLQMPPMETFKQLDVLEIGGDSPKRWSVCVDLWTEEEGKSDLSLELTLLDSNSELLDVQVDDLHVL